MEKSKNYRAGVEFPFSPLCPAGGGGSRSGVPRSTRLGPLVQELGGRGHSLSNWGPGGPGSQDCSEGALRGSARRQETL